MSRPEDVLRSEQLEAGQQDRLAVLVAGAEPLAGAAAASMELWVDAAVGKDTNAGTSQEPLRTLGAALARVPLIIEDEVFIRVRAGTYPETLSKTLLGTRSRSKVVIDGQDWSPFSPQTGRASGTFTAFQGQTAVLAGAGWTTNELRGRFVKVLTGALAGRCLPIAGNTVEGIEVASDLYTGLNGASFELVTQAVIITGEPAAQACIDLTGSVGPITLFQVRNARLVSQSFYGARLGTGAALTLQACHVSGGTVAGALMSGTGVSALLQDSFFDGSPYSIYCSYGDNLQLSGSVLHGAQYGILSFMLRSLRFSNTDQSIIQYATRVGLGPGTHTFIDGNRVLIRNCAVGMSTGGYINCELDGVEIRECTSHGVIVEDGQYAACAALSMSGWKIRNNGGDGIRFHSPHALVQLDGRADISGNGGYGINLLGGPVSSHNSVTVAYDCTMSGNASGDILINPAGAQTLADLRAAADQRLVNPNDFHRVKGT
jgi:hypothetical protein